MIGLDTNILARYYIDDAADSQSGEQRLHARALVESGQTLMVCKTVLLEFEWIMRGFYGFKPDDVLAVFQHLLSLDHIEIEDRITVDNAMSGLEQGLEFADVLHHACYRACDSVASFDDKKFARRLNKLGIMPRVFVPG